MDEATCEGIAEVLADGDAEVNDWKRMSTASARAEFGAALSASRARYGTKNGQQIRPRNWTVEARTPLTTDKATTGCVGIAELAR